ncbi:MAG: HAMP domain-containing histidine kinase [Eubacteriaceae bacterium]|nr:HAMP domain-containing histidine kinase [Eubacteriaceae bacterium]
MNKIMHKLWAGMMILALFIVALIWIFQIFFLEEYYVSHKIEDVSTKIYQVVNGVDLADPAKTYEELDALAYSENISIEIINRDKKTIYLSSENADVNYAAISKNAENQEYSVTPLSSVRLASGSGGNTVGSGQGGSAGNESGSGSGSGTDSGNGSGAGSGSGQGTGGFMLNRTVTQELLDSALSGEQTVIETVHPRFGFELLIIAIPFKDYAGTNHAALAAMPIAPIDEMIELLNRQLLLITMIMIILSIIISYLIAGSLSRPIKKLTSAAEDIASGKLDVRTDIQSKDEIGALGKAFNKMAEKLQKTEKLRKEIIENVSHELRTPLSIIKGYSETIRDVTGDNKLKRDTQLNIISDESNRLGVMIDDILDYSQIQSGFLSLNYAKFDIADMISNCINKYDIILKESGSRILFENDVEIQVYADRFRIEQVLQNLIKNAVNYSPDGENIEVSLEIMPEKVRVAVKDHGIGIPEEEKDSIWERYYRTKGIKKRKIYGSGLGLSIVKSILDAHDTDYAVISKPGIGTTFWFELKRG